MGRLFGRGKNEVSRVRLENIDVDSTEELDDAALAELDKEVGVRLEELIDKLDATQAKYYDEHPEYGEEDDPLQEKQSEDYTVTKVSRIGAKFYLWRMNRLDALRNLFRRKDKVSADLTKATKRQVKKLLRTQAQTITRAERDKLYSQFVNRLILLLINGIAVGGLLLAAMDYMLNAQIPERSPLVLGLFLIITLYCAGYWYMTFKRNKGVEGVRGLAVYALIISLVGVGAGGFDMYHNVNNLNTYFSGENIIIKDKKETATRIAGYIDTWRHTPNYSLAYISDTAYYAMVYNSKGESVTQLIQEGAETPENDTIQDVAITLRDSTAVIVTDNKIERRRDVDNLRYVELAFLWASEGKADIERVSVSDDVIAKDRVPADTMPGTEYAAKIKGIAKIREFYSTVLGDAATTSMLQSLAVSGDDVELRFHVSISQAYLGVAAVITVEGVDSLLWFIDNYVEVYDWSLGEDDWYTYDFKDAVKNELMIETAVHNASSMLAQYGMDSGLSYQDENFSDVDPDVELPNIDFEAITEDNLD